jgi:hypothetical protein
MARWLLREPHYLNVPGTVWEQQETDRESGKQKRRAYPVPMHLNPNDPADWNYKPTGTMHIIQGGSAFTEGAIIVCHKGKGEARDIVFVGDPTPGMEPIDDEAKEISAGFASLWKNFDVIADKADERSDYAAHILNKATDVMSETQARNAEATADMKEIMSTMAQVMAQNAALLKELVGPRRGI